MKVAVISDIHANRHAFEATLDAVAASDAAELWCLGDLVGYGAEPDACVELAREHAAVCLAGNHDLAVTGELPLDEFSRGASLAAQWTREVIAAENLAFLESLSPTGEEGAVGLYHASPRDPVWEYVLSTLLAELCLDAQTHRICLIGHSHVALSFVRREGELTTGEPQRDRDGARPGQRRMAAQPRQRGPAQRRRPAGLLAAAGPRQHGGLLLPRRLRRGRRRRRDPRGEAARLPSRAPGVRSVSMPRRPPSPRSDGTSTLRGAMLRLLLAGALGVAAALLVSCGSAGTKLIPAANAGPLQNDFEAVAQAAQSGNGSCAETEAAIRKTEQDFQALPSTVAGALRSTLHQGIVNLRKHALELCKQPLAQPTTPTTTAENDHHDPHHADDAHPDADGHHADDHGDDSHDPGHFRTRRRNASPTERNARRRGRAGRRDGRWRSWRRRRERGRRRSEMSTGDIAGRYRLEGRLGFGGMSTVHLALDMRLERQVAVKLLAEHLADDPAFVSRFQREAQAAAKLVHPNIVQVFDSGQDERTGQYFIVMEYIEGSSCAEILRDDGWVEVEEGLSIIEQACEGLHYAHRNGLVTGTSSPATCCAPAKAM